MPDFSFASDPLLFAIFLIFFGAAVIATLALFARQAMLVGYIVVGMVLGSAGAGLVSDSHLIHQIADIGIIFLLFLLGLNLPPQKLKRLVRETTFVTLISSNAFLLLGAGIGLLFGFGWLESLIIGLAAAFSSTIIGLKLLPTTVLHHKHTGEVITSILLLQDVLAIGGLLMIRAMEEGEGMELQAVVTVLAFPLLFLVAHWAERHLIRPLIQRFDPFREYMFLLAIAWCLLLAQVAHHVGLTYEIGSFIAGVAMARHPIALFIADSLRPLRDFFLVIFFFSIGAELSADAMLSVLPVAVVLAAVTLLVKPWVFRQLLEKSDEEPETAREVGIRLGQLSEFSILIAFLAMDVGVIGSEVSNTIQVATIITLMISPYLIITRYPSPMAIDDKLRRD